MSDLEESVHRSIVGLLWEEHARLMALVAEQELKGIPDDTYYQYLSGMVAGLARAAIQVERGYHIGGLR